MDKLILKKTKSGTYKVLIGDEKPLHDIIATKIVQKNGEVYVSLLRDDIQYFAAVDDRIQDIIGTERTLVRNVCTSASHGTLLRVNWTAVGEQTGGLRVRLRCGHLYHAAGVAKFDWVVTESEPVFDDPLQPVSEPDDICPTVEDIDEIKASYVQRLECELAKLAEKQTTLTGLLGSIKGSGSFNSLMASFKDVDDNLV